MPQLVASAETAGNDINGERETPESAWHKIFAFLMQALGMFLQLRYQGEIITIFQSNPKLVYTFVVVLSMYVATTSATYEPALGPHHSKLSYMSNLLGALMVTILLFMIEPFLGWMGFVFLAIIFFVVAARRIYTCLSEFVDRKFEETLEFLRIAIRGIAMGEEHQLPR